MADLSRCTVLVCTRDRPEMLARLLASMQPLKGSVAVLVVDSASRTAATRDVVEEAGFGYLRVDRPGLSIARNAGVAAARSDVVAFTDDDCIVGPSWLELLVDHFSDPRVGVVTGAMVDQPRPLDGAGPPPSRRARRSVHGLDLGSGANMAFRRAAVLEVGGFDERLGAGTPLAGAEDLDMFCRLLHAGWWGVREPASAVVHAHVRQGQDHVDLIAGYARGSGAQLAKALRTSPSLGAAMSAVTVRRLALRLLRAATRGRAERAAARASARGLVVGLARGLALPLDGQVFRPSDAATSGAVAPPAPRS